MKAEQFLDAMEQIDDDMLLAARQEPQKKKNLWQRAETPIRRFGLVAAALVLVAGLAVSATAAIQYLSGIRAERNLEQEQPYEKLYRFVFDDVPSDAPDTMERYDLPMFVMDNPDYTLYRCNATESYLALEMHYAADGWQAQFLYDQTPLNGEARIKGVSFQSGEDPSTLPDIETWEDTLGSQSVLCYRLQGHSDITYLWCANGYCYSLSFAEDPGKAIAEEIFASIRTVDNIEDYVLLPFIAPADAKIETFYLPTLAKEGYALSNCFYDGSCMFGASWTNASQTFTYGYDQTALACLDPEKPLFDEAFGEVHTETANGQTYYWQEIEGWVSLKWKDEKNLFTLDGYKDELADMLAIAQSLQPVDPKDYILPVEVIRLPLGAVKNEPPARCFLAQQNRLRAEWGAFESPLYVYEQTTRNPLITELPLFYPTNGEIHTETVDGVVFTWQSIDGVTTVKWQDEDYRYALTGYDIPDTAALQSLLDGLQVVAAQECLTQ